MQQNAIFTLMDVLEPKSSKILQNTSFCIKDEVKTYGGGSEVTTEITHRVELIIDGIAVSFDKWVESGYTGEDQEQHKRCIAAGRQAAAKEALRYLVERGIEKIRESR